MQTTPKKKQTMTNDLMKTGERGTTSVSQRRVVSLHASLHELLLSMLMLMSLVEFGLLVRLV